MIRKDISKCNRGATAIEYGLIVALIALAIIGSVQALGGANGALWADNGDKIAAAIAD